MQQTYFVQNRVISFFALIIIPVLLVVKYLFNKILVKRCTTYTKFITLQGSFMDLYQGSWKVMHLDTLIDV